LRLQAAFYATRGIDTEILFCVDEDDPRGVEYAALGPNDYVVGPRLRLGGTLNYYANMYADDHGFIGFMGDDVIPRTMAWDVHVISAAPENGVVYCNDGHQGPNLPTAVFMDSEVIKKLGYMVLPGMTHLFIDNYWKELGTRLGTLTYLDHVQLEHMHPSAGKGVSDYVYEEANANHVWDADEALLKAHIDSGGLDEAVRRVLG
jgi:hypothetical protein